MRKQADAHVAPCPTFVAIFANLTTSARRTPSNRLPPSEFSLIVAASLPASFAVFFHFLGGDLKRLDMNVSRTGSSTTVYFELRDGHGSPGQCLSAVLDGG